ncbi:hypothetical protein DL95DRAFT_312223 [Leptodontidium sp. 2 PMI_412]|nr:hypothetical protein DL95DRAFT_312223 [Leptodontidium sp. 2 PMI_412]
MDKIGEPLNKLSNKLGSEAFWPTSMDKECNKAARILASFCKDESSNEQAYHADEGPKEKPKVLIKIPQKVIQNAVGLAIFTTMRTGMGFSTSGGAGVLIGRLGDGSWSPPSGIHVQTVGLGWMAGLDVYDCVVVINSYKALEAFQRVRVTLGGEISVVAGPVGVGGILESNADFRKGKYHEPVFTYVKSRGLYAGVQIDGTIIIERNNENARFYGEEVRVQQILAGQVRNVPLSASLLIQMIRKIESALP